MTADDIRREADDPYMNGHTMALLCALADEMEAAKAMHDAALSYANDSGLYQGAWLREKLEAYQPILARVEALLP